MTSVPRIAPELASLPHVPVSALEPLQDNLKELNQKEYNKLRKSLVEFGVFVPFFVWKEANKLIDGHQRQRIFVNEGWGEADVPVVYVSAASEQEAKQKLLVVSSQYGRVTQEGWDAFTWDLPDDWLLGTTKFDALPYVFRDVFDPVTQPDLELTTVDSTQVDAMRQHLEEAYQGQQIRDETLVQVFCPHCGEEFHLEKRHLS